jgi:hypothetical protein
MQLLVDLAEHLVLLVGMRQRSWTANAATAHRPCAFARSLLTGFPDSQMCAGKINARVYLVLTLCDPPVVDSARAKLNHEHSATGVPVGVR